MRSICSLIQQPSSFQSPRKGSSGISMETSLSLLKEKFLTISQAIRGYSPRGLDDESLRYDTNTPKLTKSNVVSKAVRFSGMYGTERARDWLRKCPKNGLVDETDSTRLTEYEDLQSIGKFQVAPISRERRSPIMRVYMRCSQISIFS